MDQIGGLHAVADATTTTTTSMSVVTNQRLPLQRARYIHVTDLTSAYNVDNAKLMQELERVKELNPYGNNDNNNSEKPPARLLLADGVPAELDTSEKKRLQPPKGGSNMVVLVGKIRIVVDKKRVDGSRVRLAEVEVGDETGLVSLRARDHQIDALQEISERGGAVVLRNCSLELYQGRHMRLAVTKWGKLTPYPDDVASTPSPPSKMNRERNFSLIDLTAVASESPAPGSPTGTTEPTFSSYPADPNRGHHQHSTGGGRGGGHHHRGKKPHPHQQQRQQVRHSPPMMPSALHPHYIDPAAAATNQQFQSNAMHYDGRFALPPPQHQYFSSPPPPQGRPLAHGASMGQAQQQQSMMYNNNMRQRGGAPPPPQQMGVGYPPIRSPQEQQQPQHQMVGAPHLFDATQEQQRQQQQQSHVPYGSPGSHHMQSPSHMNPQAATFDPSLYPSYHGS